MFGRVIVAVVGSSKSGKTTAIEALIRGLTERGYNVASAKHIPDPEFTLDTEGKDTWRHAKAGASTVLSVAPKELTTIKKVDTTEYTLEQITAEFEEADIIILEGFKAIAGQDATIPKIVAVKTVDEISAALESYKNILAFIGTIPEKKGKTEIPFIDVLKESEKLVDLVNQKVAILVERKRKQEEKITIQVDGRFVPLSPFVQKIVGETILAMISTLKEIKIKGEEKVSIVIKRLSRG
ncbi:MAG: molybdopterin-guanine dinucleotide biosynthesis protein B [Candidatus Bathyarchaeum sp.]|nr:MAG: molybdopterin-guanine dinucleotide biosynthesis protein B [Candidatus Bathyarchaeum sp.]